MNDRALLYLGTVIFRATGNRCSEVSTLLAHQCLRHVDELIEGHIEGEGFDAQVKRAKVDIIKRAVEETGSKSAAAVKLGCSRAYVYRVMAMLEKEAA